VHELYKESCNVSLIFTKIVNKGASGMFKTCTTILFLVRLLVYHFCYQMKECFVISVYFKEVDTARKLFSHKYFFKYFSDLPLTELSIVVDVIKTTK